MLYNLIILKITRNIEAHCIGHLADSQLKSHTNKCSESENNAVSHTTFSVQLAYWPGPN